MAICQFVTTNISTNSKYEYTRGDPAEAAKDRAVEDLTSVRDYISVRGNLYEYELIIFIRAHSRGSNLADPLKKTDLFVTICRFVTIKMSMS